jgi:ABC-type transport system substrate-binding protein
MAILNWNLSLYPGYLCEWFGGQGQFNYGSDRIKSDCEALNVESDLAAAQKDAFDIQAVLAQDLPFIPLFTDVHYDAYRNVHYPFESVLGGLGGLYGAPSYAMP